LSVTAYSQEENATSCTPCSIQSYGAMNSDSTPSFWRYLALCLGMALGLCAAVEISCLALGIAPFFTPSPALNAKLRFLRNHPPGNGAVTLVSGASVALNDIDTDLLEDAEHRPFLNFGANGVSVPTSQRIYDQLSGLFAIREVIFAVDPLEMRDTYRLDVQIPTAVLQRYVSGRMTFAEEFAYRDLPGLMSSWKSRRDYQTRTVPTSLLFSKTGAVPLEIGQGNVDPWAWNGVRIDPETICRHCTDDLQKFCSEVRSQGRPFTIVLGPIRDEVLRSLPEVRMVVADRRARIRHLAQACGAGLFDLTEFASVDDSCFANSVHLNAGGMHAMTEQFARFRQGELLPKDMTISCAQIPSVQIIEGVAAKPRSQ
jgi:hypothetical protein